MIACPKCGNETHVEETRSSGISARRRRRCVNPKCRTRCTTYEVLAEVDGTRSMEDPCVLARRDLEQIIELAQASIRRSVSPTK